MKRALSVKQLAQINFKTIPFTGQWLDAVGEPAYSGAWMIWGHSGNGKTRFALQLAKYLSDFGIVAYNSLEEGVSRSLQKAVCEAQMDEIRENQFYLLDKEPLEDLKLRMQRRRRSPDFIIIDSFQYTGLTWPQYKRLRTDFPDKLFLFISHADGKNPEGRTAKKVRYDADVKIHIRGFEAHVTSRFGGGLPYVIWKEGAELYHLKTNAK